MSKRQPGRVSRPFSLFLQCLVAVFAANCGQDTDSTPPRPLTCTAPEALCDGACVDISTDDTNCGACGAACSADERCSASACVLDCIAGQTACGSDCVDTAKDIANCGACGQACGAGEVCSNGSCALSCQTSLSDCNGTCVDTTKDLANCGACGQACAAGEVCSNGSCALSCQVDLTDCGGICVDLTSSLSNCGMCSVVCSAGEVCSNGTCALSCQAGLTDCNGLCVDLNSSLAHCGACGSACAFDEVCDGGSCKSTTPVDLQFISFSDWHGQLDPLTVGGIDIGGAAVLSAYFHNERMQNPNTLVTTQGDAFGASPPLASFFNETPAVLALNLMGIDYDVLGNHNFDKKVPHLQSMINLATYKYISSNLNQLTMNVSGVLSPYQIVDIAGVRVGIVGITNPDAPGSTQPGGLGTMTVADPIASAMTAKAAAEASGAKLMVALTHLGANLCDQATGVCTGPLIDFAKGVTGFDLILGDHTDWQVNQIINGARVVENRSKGLTYSRSVLTVVPWTGVVTKNPTTFISPIKSAVTPDPAVDAMLQTYRTQLNTLLDTPIGVATNIFPRGGNIERLGEVAVGDLTADSMRIKYGAQLALCNGGGLRAPLPSSYLPANTLLRRNSPGYAAGPPYDLVKGDAYAELPFGNVVVTRTITGAQLWAAMENGVSVMPGAAGRFPQISGFGFSWSQSAPSGSRVVEIHLEGGAPILKDQTTYTFAVADFLNNGGDGYAIFADGQGTTRDLMADVLVEHITTLGTITPTIAGRILPLP